MSLSRGLVADASLPDMLAEGHYMMTATRVVGFSVKDLLRGFVGAAKDLFGRAFRLQPTPITPSEY